MLRAQCRRAARNDKECLDLTALALHATIFRDSDGCELVRLSDGRKHFRLQLKGDSIADGPVHLSYHLSGLTHLDASARGLQRLSAISRLGRLPNALYPPDPIVVKGIRALRAWDGARAGASHRDIAVGIFGRHMITEASFDSMRKRVTRLISLADHNINTAWRRFTGT